MYKTSIFILMFFIFQNSSSQTNKYKLFSVVTTYSMLAENDNMGKEKLTFKFNNGMITKIDPYYNTVETYPGALDETFFNSDGNFVETFTSREYITKYPLEAVNLVEDMKAYKVVYDEKGGEILYVVELSKKRETITNKIFFTDRGKQFYNNHY